jgi:hypothetical protein
MRKLISFAGTLLLASCVAAEDGRENQLQGDIAESSESSNSREGRSPASDPSLGIAAERGSERILSWSSDVGEGASSSTIGTAADSLVVSQPNVWRCTYCGCDYRGGYCEQRCYSSSDPDREVARAEAQERCQIRDPYNGGCWFAGCDWGPRFGGSSRL